MAPANEREVRAAPLSPQLRGVVESLLQSRDDFAREAIAAFKREIPAYGDITDPAVWDEVAENVQENAQLWYASLLSGTPLSAEHLAKVAAFARNRVHQGVPLPEVLQAFRIGAAVLWSNLLAEVRLNPEIEGEVLFEVSSRFFDFIERVSRTTTEAYTAELGTRLRLRDRLQHELVELVFSTHPDEEQFRKRMTALGMDPLALHAAIAVGVVQPPAETEAEAGPRRAWRPLDALRERLPSRADAMIEAVRGGALLLWVPTPEVDIEVWEREVLVAAANAVASTDAAVERIGVGTPGRGAQGWQVAAEQALRALELGPQVHSEQKVHRYADLAIYDIARRTPQVAQFLQTCIDRLAGNMELLDSLGSWFDHARHLKPAAASLHVHPNTLAYRLKRVEDLLGGTFEDPEWTLRLQLALKLRQCQ